jgi:hypothetical protein
MTSPDTDRLLRELLARAASAPTTRERQFVALVTAYLDGDHDRVDVLAREHLVDHPDDVLASWIASLARSEQHSEQNSGQHSGQRSGQPKEKS